MSLKKTSFGKYILAVLIIVFIAVLSISYNYYLKIFKSNIVIENKEFEYIYIPTGSSFYDVKKILLDNNIISDINSFLWLAEKKNYKNHVYPGKYRINKNMNNNELINMLRSASQEPVNVIFNNIRTKSDLAGKISKQIEADSLEIIAILNNESYLAENSLNVENAMTLFIPNTYEFYWNTNASSFFKRMLSENNKFWITGRTDKLERINLTQTEVIILASIVEEETQKDDEKERLAGVYINRLNKGMRLQADPTVKFALGDFEMKRVLLAHLSYDSPYNTYKYKGLPPGPIRIPSIITIDAVLNYEQHNYLYFCAKDDFSGYHEFAKTLRQHNINAQKYQSALNKNRVFK